MLQFEQIGDVNPDYTFNWIIKTGEVITLAEFVKELQNDSDLVSAKLNICPFGFEIRRDGVSISPDEITDDFGMLSEHRDWIVKNAKALEAYGDFYINIEVRPH